MAAVTVHLLIGTPSGAITCVYALKGRWSEGKKYTVSAGNTDKMHVVYVSDSKQTRHQIIIHPNPSTDRKTRWTNELKSID